MSTKEQEGYYNKSRSLKAEYAADVCVACDESFPQMSPLLSSSGH
jgi:hypothetical protein